jgi:hypothetical protein
MMLPQSMQDGESALTEKATRWPTPSEAKPLPPPLPLPLTTSFAAGAPDPAAEARAAVGVVEVAGRSPPALPEEVEEAGGRAASEWS